MCNKKKKKAVIANPVNVYVLLREGKQSHLAENTKEIVRPLGSWSQSGVRTDKGVVAERSFVNIVERAHFLISRVFPKENVKKKVNMSNKILRSGMEPAAPILIES